VNVVKRKVEIFIQLLCGMPFTVNAGVKNEKISPDFFIIPTRLCALLVAGLHRHFIFIHLLHKSNLLYKIQYSSIICGMILLLPMASQSVSKNWLH
jgi:hypothetical protein